MKKLIVFLVFGLLIAGLLSGLVNAQWSGRNYGEFPTMWGSNWYFPDRVIYPGDPQIAFLDYAVNQTDGIPSVRIEGYDWGANVGREVDWTGGVMDQWHIAVAPGDHIVYGIWVKTGANTTVLDPELVWHGAYIGFDMYHNNQRVWEYGDGSTTDFSSGHNFDYVVNYHHVDYGTSAWTLLEMDVYIPDDVFTVDDYGVSLGGSYQINYIIPWFSMRWMDTGEDGAGWFTNAYIYKNSVYTPPTSPTPTPTIPSGTPLVDDATAAFGDFALWFAVVLVFVLPVVLLCMYPLKLGKWGFFVGLVVGLVLNYTLNIVAFQSTYFWGFVLISLTVVGMAVASMRGSGG